MRLLLVPSLAVLLLSAPLRGAEPTAPAPVKPGATAALPAIDAAAPESAILLPARVLRDNDFKAFFLNMPAEDQAKAQADWKAAQARIEDPAADAQGIAGFNQFLGKLLAPGAADALVAEAGPNLAQMKPAELSQGLQMMAGFLPMMLQGKPGQPVDPVVAQERAAWTTMLQGVLSDASAWVLTAGINDQAKLKQVVTHLITGAKALGVTDAKELQKLPLEDFLARLSPIISEVKASLGVYDLQVDAFLGSLTAVPKDAAGDERLLDVGFKAFGKAYTVPVHVTKKGNHWVLSDKNGETLGGMKQMIGGPGGDAPGLEAPGEPLPGFAEPAKPGQPGEAPAPSVAVPITP